MESCCKRSRQSYNILSYLSVGFWAPARLIKGSSGKACCNCLALLHYRSLVYILIRLLICRCSHYEAKLKSMCANYCNCLTCKKENTWLCTNRLIGCSTADGLKITLRLCQNAWISNKQMFLTLLMYCIISIRVRWISCGLYQQTSS